MGDFKPKKITVVFQFEDAKTTPRKMEIEDTDLVLGITNILLYVMKHPEEDKP